MSLSLQSYSFLQIHLLYFPLRCIEWGVYHNRKVYSLTGNT